MTTESADIVAEYVAALDIASIPTTVLDAAKVSIIDTLGVMCAGSTGHDVGSVLKVARSWGGKPESTVIGHTEKAPSYLAVLSNGAMVHQLDWDDTHDRAVCHPGAAALPASLALAEADGDVTGTELLVAFVAGSDLASRLGLAIRGTLWDYPWVRAPVVGMFGAAAAGSRVLGFDAEQISNAFGLALPQVGATLACLETPGSSVRTIRDGLAYKDAVLAVGLASLGTQGDRGVFDGPYGLFPAFFAGDYDRSEIVDGLGERYETAHVSIKPWPSCRHTHGPLTAFFDAMAASGRGHDEIAAVVAHVGASNQRLFRTGVDDGYPDNHAGALCNLRYALSVALAEGRVAPASFDEANLDSAAVREAYGRVSWVRAEEFDAAGTIEPGWIDIEFTDGTVATGRVEQALGHPDNPLSLEQLRAKVDLCLETGRLEPGSEAVDDLFEVVLDLENRAVSDLSAALGRLWSDG